MAGLTNTGLVIKRLPEIINSLNSKATSLFQDLVPPGDTLNITPGSILGRMIGIQAADLADLWEELQEVHSAYNPNAAQGIALDNQVFLGGLERFSASPTKAYVFMSGSYNTVITQGSTVSSSFTGRTFTTDEEITLDANGISGFTLAVPTISATTAYTVQISDGLRTISCTYTSDSSPTSIEILNGLKAQIDAAAGSMVTTTILDNIYVVVTVIDHFVPVTVTLTGPIQIFKSTKQVTVTATENGPLEQGANTIDSIATPILGWDKAVNYISATTGRDRETDEELRLRFRNSKYVRGSNLEDALYSDLLAVVGVKEAITIVNDTDSTDSNGIPAHSFMVIVNGGAAEDIVKAIWKNKPPGIKTSGSQSGSVADAAGNMKTVNFQRPIPLLYYISINISTDANFPPDGVDRIKAALVNFNKTTYSIGDDVVYSRLYSPINSVPGHQVNSLKIGTSASPTGTANITTAFNEIPTLDAVRIVVTVT